MLLKERHVPSLQADLVGHLCHEFDSDHVAETISDEVRKWLRDLGIAKRKNEKVVTFVSYGGTCRDPMAKAITLKLLEANPPGFRLRVEAGGLFQPTATTVSYAAREAIREMFGEDLLANHRVSKMTAERIAEADLILVMAASLLQKNTFHPGKTFFLKPFLGLEGDVEDPFPDGADPATLARYRNCAHELHDTLQKNIGRLVDFLRPQTNRDVDDRT